MLTQRQKNIYWFILLLTVVGLGLYFAFLKDKKLHKNASITTGEVYDVVGYSKSTNAFVKYKYIVNGKVFRSQRSIIGVGDNSDNLNLLSKILIRKYFPVIYDTTDFENSEILFTKKQYSHYNVTRNTKYNKEFAVIDSLVETQ